MNALEAYKILGLPPGSSPKLVKKAYRRLVKQWHPDRFANQPGLRPEAEERIKQINLAFEQTQQPADLLSLALRARQSARPRPPTPAQPKGQPANAPPRPASRPRPASTAAPQTAVCAPLSGMQWAVLLVASGLSVLALLNLPAQPTNPKAPGRPASVPISKSGTDSAMPGTARPPPIPTIQLLAQAEASVRPVVRDSTAEPAVANVRAAQLQPTVAMENRLAKNSADEGREASNNSGVVEPGPNEAAVAADLAGKYYRIGLDYLQGREVKTDPAQAASYFLQAAVAGHRDAQKQLGFLYASGKGVPRNLTEARVWLNAAAEAGDQEAAMAAALLRAP